MKTVKFDSGARAVVGLRNLNHDRIKSVFRLITLQLPATSDHQLVKTSTWSNFSDQEAGTADAVCPVLSLILVVASIKYCITSYLVTLAHLSKLLHNPRQSALRSHLIYFYLN